MKIVIALVVVSTIVTGYSYIQSLRSELKAAAEREARMDDVITGQKKAMDTIQADVKRMSQTQNELNAKLNEAEQGRRDLEHKFNQSSNGKTRDFSALANKEPQRVEDSANRGTRDALRCNELVSGSPLTADEQAGKTRNTMCPGLLPPSTAPAAQPRPAATAPTNTDTTPPAGQTKVDLSKIKRAPQ
jgi:uncharacterized phage infection (PIP) family protein YhgE